MRLVYCGQSPSTRLRAATSSVAAAIAVLSTQAMAAGALPQNGQFAAGAGSINSTGNQVDITQSSARGVINWDSFSIGRNNTVNVNNGSGATLSRVTGATASTIDGKLNATGSFYLINPQGVVIGSHGVVTTGGRFVASTLDTTNDAFMAGGDITLKGGSSAAVVNLGSISSTGGDVFLISVAHTENGGTISAPNGTAELATGSQVLLQDSKSNPQVYVETGSGATPKGDVVNQGTIRAAQIQLESADGNIYALAGNNAALRATGTSTRDGHVWLVASNGNVQQNQSVVAKNGDGSGGTVDTDAKTVALSNTNVQAGQWNVYVDRLDAGPTNAAALASSLSNGTNVSVNTTGDINLVSTLRWNGDATFTLNAGGNVSVGSVTTLSNVGAGNLILHADANGVDSGKGVTNSGTIDWSKSTGTVAVLYDMSGAWKPGTIRTNGAWSAAPFSGLKTQVTAYQLVNSIDDLNKISQNLAGNYALGRDLQSTSDVFLTSIGAGSATGFTGQFDGFGHQLDTFQWYGSYDTSGVQAPVGLFSTIGAAGVVRNLDVTNAFANVGYEPGGIIAGTSAGLISNVSVSGRIANPTEPGQDVGGIVGDNNGTISRALSSAAVGGGNTGGIAGVNNGFIVQSASTGDVAGGSHTEAGGIAGVNYGDIRQSYVTGSVDASDVGGIVDRNYGNIQESFVAATLTRNIPPLGPGGIAADNEGTIASNVYWDKQITGTTDGTQGGTPVPAANGLTTAQMSKAKSFGPSWNFAPGGTWTFVTGVDHPVLQWQVAR